jgi:hypothetical protein
MTIRAPIRLLILSAAIVATLSACNRDDDKARAPASTTPGEAFATAPATPLTYESTTPFSEVELTLAQGITAYPDLHAQLYQTVVRELNQFNEGAQADRTEAGGDAGQAAYSRTVAFGPAAETPRLFALKRDDYEFTGGAHGNGVSTGVLWDKTTRRQLKPADLFRAGADLKAMNTALCAAINAEKRTRGEGVEPVTANGDLWACPDASATAFTLAPGANGKAGGLTFLIGPYVVGPYVEGSYEVVVPTAVFAPLLAPDYAGEFG